APDKQGLGSDSGVNARELVNDLPIDGGEEPRLLSKDARGREKRRHEELVKIAVQAAHVREAALESERRAPHGWYSHGRAYHRVTERYVSERGIEFDDLGVVLRNFGVTE